ncbi:AAA family ATPase [Ileibacterium valens]|uniref:AAA family ATPase n=2 Tax=Ileibacterium valens TaxID=1862668 RepID=UPI00257040C3|nr:ATP-binding protein [Ileibacterium valens]
MLLLEFKTGNYRSIKEPICISMIANNCQSRKRSIITTKAFIGRNGTGKTNLLRAMFAGVQIIKESIYLMPGESIPEISPFIFDKYSKTEPTFFEFNFVLDNTQFIYSYSATRTQIVSEVLYRFKNDSKSIVFQREYQKFDFSKKKNQFKKLKEMTSENKLFLSVAAHFNETECSEVFKALTQSFLFANPNSLNQLAKQIALYDYSNRYKNQILDFLNKVDLDITDYEILDERHNRTIHRVHSSDYFLSLNQESEGTQKYLYLLHCLFKAIQKGKILVVDEIESSLYPSLVEEIIQWFNDPEFNQKSSQLIFSTHDYFLLTTDQIAEEQVDIIRINKEAQFTELIPFCNQAKLEKDVLINHSFSEFFTSISGMLD